MLRNVSLEEISDGRLYGLNDMAKLGCNDCSGCSSCCRGMGNTIVLDPYDVWRLTGGLGVSLQQLLAGHLELNVVDGIILPNLKLAGDSEQCTFLNEAGRCSIIRTGRGFADCSVRAGIMKRMGSGYIRRYMNARSRTAAR